MRRRRRKLARDERARRSAKRIRRALARRVRVERVAYDAAVADGQLLTLASRRRVVCDRCRLEQAYETAREGEEVRPCEGFEGIGCGGLTCVTVERFAEETA